MKIEFSAGDLERGIYYNSSFTMKDGSGAFKTDEGRKMAEKAVKKIVRNLLGRKQKYVLEVPEAR